jgi:hypothetical protein
MRSGAKVKPKIIPCTRPSWPAMQALYDLSRDSQAVEEILREIQPFFRFKVNEVRFSGYARRVRPERTHATDPLFYVQIWNGTSLYHTVAFRQLKYHGILHVDLVRSDRVERIMDDDPVSVVWNGLEHWTNLDPDFQHGQIWYANRENLEVSIPWKELRATRTREFLDGQ